MAHDVGAQHLRPFEQRCIVSLAALLGESLGDIDQSIGLRRDRGKGRLGARRRCRGRAQCLAQRIQRGFELARRDAVIAAIVVQSARKPLQLLGAILDPAQVLGPKGRLGAPLPARAVEGEQMPRQITAVDRGDVPGIERAQVVRVVPVVGMTAITFQSAPTSTNVASRRSSASSVPIQPKSRAAATESRYRPILVGEVRLAMTAFGTSWKLSGGSMLCLGVTKVSK